VYIRQAAGREVALRERGILPLVSVRKPPASAQGRRLAAHRRHLKRKHEALKPSKMWR
jgi:hypothetical protein